jgi:hypothetical protein
MILLKYPTRKRPQLFLSTLRGWLSRAGDLSKVGVLVSYDSDDSSMTEQVVVEAKGMHSNVAAVQGQNHTKIEACNADINDYKGDWSIIIMLSDDMICCVDGWDHIVRKHMLAHYPDTDGALWFFDGYQRDFNAMECVGRKRYDRFGYLYHPSYISFSCDRETTDIGLRDKALTFVDEQICRHESPYWGKGIPFDELYQVNSVWYTKDRATYAARKALGFPPA